MGFVFLSFLWDEGTGITKAVCTCFLGFFGFKYFATIFLDSLQISSSCWPLKLSIASSWAFSILVSLLGSSSTLASTSFSLVSLVSCETFSSARTSLLLTWFESLSASSGNSFSVVLEDETFTLELLIATSLELWDLVILFVELRQDSGCPTCFCRGLFPFCTSCLFLLCNSWSCSSLLLFLGIAEKETFSKALLTSCLAFCSLVRLGFFGFLFSVSLACSFLFLLFVVFWPSLMFLKAEFASSFALSSL